MYCIYGLVILMGYSSFSVHFNEVLLYVRIQGLGEDVPRYLRWEGHIPNHRLSQTQINSLIDGFWKHCLSHSDIHSLVVRQ